MYFSSRQHETQILGKQFAAVSSEKVLKMKEGGGKINISAVSLDCLVLSSTTPQKTFDDAGERR